MSGPDEKWFKQRQSDIDAIIEAEKEKENPNEDFIRYQENLRSNYEIDEPEEEPEEEPDDYNDDENN